MVPVGENGQYKTFNIFKTVFGSTSDLNGFGTLQSYYFTDVLDVNLNFEALNLICIDLYGKLKITMTSCPTSSGKTSTVTSYTLETHVYDVIAGFAIPSAHSAFLARFNYHMVRIIRFYVIL